ncbi:hypothetical protein PFTANZ_03884 [Plasmodium falciparum Tanzania (2000708)]|uniref:rRNA-processing protein FYV7 n=1 Tax=Plasmodium falciparum Tanzania (2000708) TaxID=1036725 RepID=A0A024W5N0_PLAFA|nr:hypothetical protein PFTANZ_03884 [Plasmodium falciparum Tanzania (2000708)]
MYIHTFEHKDLRILQPIIKISLHCKYPKRCVVFSISFLPEHAFWLLCFPNENKKKKYFTDQKFLRKFKKSRQPNEDTVKVEKIDPIKNFFFTPNHITQEEGKDKNEEKIINSYEKKKKKNYKDYKKVGHDQLNGGNISDDNIISGDDINDDNISGDNINDDNISDDNIISGDDINDDNISGDNINDDNISGDNINDDNISGDNINDDNINDDNIKDNNIYNEKRENKKQMIGFNNTEKKKKKSVYSKEIKYSKLKESEKESYMKQKQIMIEENEKERQKKKLLRLEKFKKLTKKTKKGQPVMKNIINHLMKKI